MTALRLDTDRLSQNPLDIAEQLIESREWLFDRPMDEELVAEVTGSWCNYRIWFTWQPDLEVMIFTCAFDSRVPEASAKQVYPILGAVNEKMWLGHFDLCSQEHVILFRHAVLLRGANGVSASQIEDLIDIAINECNRFYPAFQSVIWGGNSCQEALDIALMDTVGEA